MLLSDATIKERSKANFPYQEEGESRAAWKEGALEVRDLYERHLSQQRELVQELVNSGGHDSLCDKYDMAEGMELSFDDDQPCTCGWSAALAKAAALNILPQKP